jgi:hypothetical protein
MVSAACAAALSFSFSFPRPFALCSLPPALPSIWTSHSQSPTSTQSAPQTLLTPSSPFPFPVTWFSSRLTPPGQCLDVERGSTGQSLLPYSALENVQTWQDIPSPTTPQRPQSLSQSQPQLLVHSPYLAVLLPTCRMVRRERGRRLDDRRYLESTHGQ